MPLLAKGEQRYSSRGQQDAANVERFLGLLEDGKDLPPDPRVVRVLSGCASPTSTCTRLRQPAAELHQYGLLRGLCRQVTAFSPQVQKGPCLCRMCSILPDLGAALSPLGDSWQLAVGQQV